MSNYHVEYDILPKHMRDGAKRYIEDRIAPGGFMTAVLENNFVEAVGRADATNKLHLENWAHWLMWQCPSKAWGSPLKVKTWLISEEDSP